MMIHSATPRGMESTSVDAALHHMELEAYGAVLKALEAQGGPTWEIMDTLIELRKQLRISDFEHKELTNKATTDDSVVMLRQLREGTLAQKELHSNNMNPALPVDSMTQVPAKKLKISHVPMFSFPNYPSDARLLPAPTHSLAVHFSSQSLGKATIFSSGEGNALPKNSVPPNKRLSVGGKGVIIQSKKGVQLKEDTNNAKKRLGTIEIRATNMLIREVERLICSGVCPDVGQVEKAKSLLKDQEKAILEALNKLAEISDEGDPRQHYDEHQRGGLQVGTQYAFYEQVDTMRSYYNPGLNVDNTDERGNRFSESANYLVTP